ncbi:hypothetical protein [Nannocystis punicea]|uniref:Phage tail protein n=1 Tax=Nannocystis punicea TaxID=2995304 RepID=A0ABY7GX75_9BACT|nr:hypothetical protein [Nannocystis poenicansa]WAS91588.1 hypothetical protein O0S08_35860 [Nannocystis poenicansa]
MATVAQLAAAEFQEIGYLFLIEGWPVAFTNRIELVGSGPGSWIGDEVNVGKGRTVALGLEVDGTVKMEIGLVDSGMVLDTNRSFTVVDREGHIIRYFEDEPGVRLIDRLEPRDTPAPSSLLDEGGNGVELHGRWVSGESIGPNGQRRQYQVIPDPLPGYDHAAVNSTAEDHLAPVLVRQEARHHEGLPCALYLIRRDPVTGEWPGWKEQFESGRSLIFWGVVRNPPTVQGYAWRFDVEGPQSWLRKTLNTTRPTTWAEATPLLELQPKENLIAASFHYMYANSTRLDGAFSAYHEVLDALTPTGLTQNELAAQINDRLQALAAAAGPDITFNTHIPASVGFTADEVTIQIQANNGENIVVDNPAYGAIMRLRMHSSVWLYLGYDLSEAGQGKPAMSPLESENEIEAFAGNKFETWTSSTPDPTTGTWWTAHFDTLPMSQVWFTSPHTVDGDGVQRVYRPYYEDTLGVGVLQQGFGTMLDVGYGNGEQPYFPGQLALPPPTKTLPSGDVDTAGFVLVKGVRKTSTDGDEEEVYALGRAGWVNDDGMIAATDLDRALMWIEDWLPQEQWGAPPFKGPWAIKKVEFTPIVLLGYNFKGIPDQAHNILARLLLSTGSAYWTGDVVTTGLNTHDDAEGPADDREMADLGLGIPQSMVDLLSFKVAAQSLPNNVAGPLNQTRLAFLGPFDALELIEQICKPRGWAMSLKDGKYGLFNRFATLDLDDVEVHLGPSDIAAGPNDAPPSETVAFDRMLPIDLVEVTYGGNQLLQETGDKVVRVKAKDSRSTQRRGNAKLEIDGRTLLADGSWQKEFEKFWSLDGARFYAEPWTVVRVPVKGHKAGAIWPGTIVSYSSPWPATRSGAYGMSQRVGRVISVERDLMTLGATIEILVQAGDPTTKRRFSPLARLIDGHTTVEARHDAENRRITCYADAWGRGSETPDVGGFIKPDWATGTEAKAHVFSSWDGVSWELTATFTVESVDPDANAIIYAKGSLEVHDQYGIWDRRYGIITLAKYDDQEASSWARQVFGVLCDSDLKFGAGDTPGFPWVV